MRKSLTLFSRVCARVCVYVCVCPLIVCRRTTRQFGGPLLLSPEPRQKVRSTRYFCYLHNNNNNIVLGTYCGSGICTVSNIIMLTRPVHVCARGGGIFSFRKPRGEAGSLLIKTSSSSTHSRQSVTVSFTVRFQSRYSVDLHAVNGSHLQTPSPTVACYRHGSRRMIIAATRPVFNTKQYILKQFFDIFFFLSVFFFILSIFFEIATEFCLPSWFYFPTPEKTATA